MGEERERERERERETSILRHKIRRLIRCGRVLAKRKNKRNKHRKEKTNTGKKQERLCPIPKLRFKEQSYWTTWPSGLRRHVISQLIVATERPRFESGLGNGHLYGNYYVMETMQQAVYPP